MDPYAIVIIITGYSDIKTAVDVIKSGAFDYITKPLIPEEVLNVIGRALQQSSDGFDSPRLAASVQAGKKNGKSFGDDEYLVGHAPATKELYRQVELVAPTNYSIILYGESGTGKEVIARTIHQNSARVGKPFIAMDCGTLSKELAGSELFGHVKGAFTGALNDKEGHFELANGGTLFLDEVGNLSYEIQAALLRVIQERKFKRVGGTKRKWKPTFVLSSPPMKIYKMLTGAGSSGRIFFIGSTSFPSYCPPSVTERKTYPCLPISSWPNPIKSSTRR